MDVWLAKWRDRRGVDGWMDDRWSMNGGMDEK